MTKEEIVKKLFTDHKVFLTSNEIHTVYEAMELFAKQSKQENDKVVSIYRFQLDDVKEALRVVANTYKCRDQVTCMDRMVSQAEQYVINALNGEKDKPVRYGVHTKDQ